MVYVNIQFLQNNVSICLFKLNGKIFSIYYTKFNQVGFEEVGFKRGQIIFQ